MNPPLTATPTSSYAGSSPNLRHQQPSNTPQLGSTPRPRQAFALPVTPGANRTIPRTDYGQGRHLKINYLNLIGF